MRFKQLTLLLTLLAFTPCLFAQSFDMEQNREQMMELKGLWHFHTGDDPHWSNPTFDDSAWPLLKSDEPWSSQGYKDYGGMAWYRFQIVLPPQHKTLALQLPFIFTSYQLFANGRLIGQFGSLPPHERVDLGAYHVFPIPPEILVPGKPLHIAIRVWHWPHWAAYQPGGPSNAATFGEIDTINDRQNYVETWLFRFEAASSLVLVINLLAGLAALGLFALHPKDREFLWFGLYEFANAASAAIVNFDAFYDHSLRIWESADAFAVMAANIFLLAFLTTMLRQRRDTLFRIAFASALLLAVFSVPGELGWISILDWNIIVNVGLLPYYVIVVFILVRRARECNLEARLLLAPVGLFFAVSALDAAFWTTQTAGVPNFRSHVEWFYRVSNWPFPFSIVHVAQILMQLAILRILVLRFARIRRDEQRFASEFEAARAVQHVLIPDQIPSVPGFQIECVYTPAGEVGGDFFQIVPLPGNCALVAIGDVSGKGMPAAMNVALLIGALRTAVDFGSSPAALLATLNEKLTGRSSGGFTTCLLLHLAPSGEMRAANAGHLAPYLNGRELKLENNLPLGLAPGAVYAETTFQLAPHDKLILLTDGVVEARNAVGELFGFERTASIASRSAHEISDAAKTFGQEDDITVLSVLLQPAS